MENKLRIPSEDVEKVKKAFQEQGFDYPEVLAKVTGCSILTVNDFLNGKPVDANNFIVIFRELKLNNFKIGYEPVYPIGSYLHQHIPSGFNLKHSLRGHDKRIIRIAWSPDGKIIASPSDDKTIKLWDAETGQLIKILEGHSEEVGNVAWSPDGYTLASGSADKTIKLWDVNTGQIIRTLEEHTELIRRVAWSPDGKILASASDDCTICLWNPKTGELYEKPRKFRDRITCVAWSPDGKILASACDDSTVLLWNITNQSRIFLENYNTFINALDVAWTPDSRFIAVAYTDATIKIWNSQTGEIKNTLQQHLSEVRGISFSFDSRFLASKSIDNSVQLWRCDTWEKVATLYEPADLKIYLWNSGLSFHPKKPILATLGEKDRIIRIWELDYNILLNQTPSTSTIHYINAKIVLVGESGVGKSGLGIRLAEKTFRETKSTHGAQFWQIPVTEKIPTQSEKIEIQAELTLWDLAGQPDYHIIHQLFLHDSDVALLLFDCSDPADPFRGVPYWAKVLKKQIPHHALKYLISARIDVSSITVTEHEINQTLAKYELNKHFKTSALTGEGVENILQKILKSIPWDKLPRTTTPELFQVIRSYLLERKEARDTLLSLTQVQQEVKQRYKEPTQVELDTVVSLLQARGIVYCLQPNPTLTYVLLQPELINQYASSIILAARNHPKGIGAILLWDVIEANFPITGFTRLEPAEEKIILDSTIKLLLKRNLCFQEMGMLVFPSQLNAPPTETDSKHPPIEVTYTFSGAIESIYASLVVRLSYTHYYQRYQLFRYSAEFFRNEDRLGFRMKQLEEGTGELQIYFDQNITNDDCINFTRFITNHLRETKGIDIHEHRHLYCPSCGKEVTNREAIEARIKAGKLEIPCQYCDTNIIIPQSIEELYQSNRDYPSSVTPDRVE